MNQPRSASMPRTGAGKGRKIARPPNITNSQIVNGDNNVVIMGDGNTVVQKIAPNQRPKVALKPVPLRVGHPAHEIYLLDRRGEKKAADQAIQSRTPLEFFCPAGFGKSTLLRYFASGLQLSDRMILIEMRNSMALEDLFQELFTAFYTSNRIYKPSQVEYKRYFENIEALILLDDVSLTREEIDCLRYTLPRCVFVIAAAEQNLWGEGSAVPLCGLPMKEAVALFEKQIGRKLTEQELPTAQWICGALDGNPLRIIQTAAPVRHDRKSLRAIAETLQAQAPAEKLQDVSLAGLPDAEKSLLAILAVLGRVPLPAEHLTGLLQTRELAPLVQDLLGRGLIKAHSPRYSLTGSLDAYLNRAWDLSRWREGLLQHFVNWSSRGPSQEQILEAGDAILKVLEEAASSKRWQELLKIGLAVEPAFILGLRWGAWARLLVLLLAASQALGQRAVEAWVLHQTGSRALSLGQFQEAREYLTRALDIRRAMGDKPGMAATQHNLRQLPGGAPPRNPPRSRGGPSQFSAWFIPTLAVIGAAVLFSLLSIWRPQILPPLLPTETYTLTPRPPSTFTPSFTPSKTITVTSSATSRPSQTPSRTPSRTLTPSYTPSITITSNVPPPAPIIVSPLKDATVICSGDPVRLVWSAPYDASGIDIYQVTLKYYDRYSSKTWITIFDQQTLSATELDITYYVQSYCGTSFSWTVMAIDRAGAWGTWSAPVSFYSDFPAPPNEPPPAPGIISPAEGTVVSCDTQGTPVPVVLQWSQPYDPSGIANYEVRVAYHNLSTGTWDVVVQKRPVYGTALDISGDLAGYCNQSQPELRWTVRAKDTGKLWGDWAPWTHFKFPAIIY